MRSPDGEIAADILDSSFGVTGIGFGIDIEAFLSSVAACLHLFKRRADLSFQFIKECSTESVAQIMIVEMMSLAPEAIIAVTALRNKAMDMRVPFEIPAEGMKDHDETGREVHGFILLKKHTGDNTVYGMEKTIEERAVIEEKVTKLFINGKDTMTVGDINELKGHRGSAFHGIFVTAGGTEAAVAAKRDKLEPAAVGQPNMAPPKEGSPQLTSYRYFLSQYPWMEGIYNLFIMVSENNL